MEAVISQPKATALMLCAFSPKIRSFRPNHLYFPVQINQRNTYLRRQVLKCAKGDSAENGEELNVEEELKRLNGKCRGIGGIVELMECLEREAIMGEDEGREPTDYNRRALIFDQSSRVFQALKQQSQSTTTTTTSSSTSCV